MHKPVLLREMIANLSPKNNETYLDATFGGGGYSSAILSSANCKLYAIDRDETAVTAAENLHKKFPNNFTFLSGKFSQAEELLATHAESRSEFRCNEADNVACENRSGGVLKHTLSNGSAARHDKRPSADRNYECDSVKLDGIVLDIGVSSMQLDDKSRGFSFDSDAVLDMRMDKKNPLTAFEVVNKFSEEELQGIIKEFGEEPRARKIAQKIVEARKKSEIKTCAQLAQIVRSTYFGYFKTDPSTRTFQAIRIFVNKELDELSAILKSSLNLLNKGGRLIVVSFHSLEDSIVKKFLKSESGMDAVRSRYLPEDTSEKARQNFKVLTKSAITPSDEEIAENYRARSAKMRVAVRI